MIQAIGFTNKFYTLWSIDSQEGYTTDAYGKHWLTGYNTNYTYHKNISFDFDKVKILYPNLEFQEDLRGKSKSWISENKEDLCPHIIKYGNYYGQDINEILVKDFQYLVWICENKGYSSNGKYIKLLPEIKEYFKSIEDERNEAINNRNISFEKILNEGIYEFIPERNLTIIDGEAYIFVSDGDLNINFKFIEGSFSYNSYNGFAYGLPIVNGKSKRIKGKKVKFKFTEDRNEKYQVIVNNVIIDK